MNVKYEDLTSNTSYEANGEDYSALSDVSAADIYDGTATKWNCEVLNSLTGMTCNLFLPMST